MKKIEPIIKYLLPKTLFGRSLVIIVTPLILMQAISTFVFFDRHWDTMTRRLSHTLAGDIAFIIDAITPIGSEEKLDNVRDRAEKILHIKLTYSPDKILLNSAKTDGDRVQKTLSKAMTERVKRPFLIDSEKLDRRVLVYIQLAKGVLTIDVHRKRLYSLLATRFGIHRYPKHNLQDVRGAAGCSESCIAPWLTHAECFTADDIFETPITMKCGSDAAASGSNSRKKVFPH